ncbi:MAG: hypothetical protein ACN4GW_02590 [Desulforhopalus sp.]
MITELLIIKGGDNYYRFSEGEFSSCNMSKASVFSLDRQGEAKHLCELVRKSGVSADLMKLTIREEPFVE